jgi:hypothetical protein
MCKTPGRGQPVDDAARPGPRIWASHGSPPISQAALPSWCGHRGELRGQGEIIALTTTTIDDQGRPSWTELGRSDEMINHVFIREHSFGIETVDISRPGFFTLKNGPSTGCFLALRQPKPDLPDKPIPGALLPRQFGGAPPSSEPTDFGSLTLPEKRSMNPTYQSRPGHDSTSANSLRKLGSR